MTSAEQYVRTRLFELQDKDYRLFQCKLMPSVAPENVIGVRTPVLRAFAKEFAAMPIAKQFIAALPHRYYEENNLHGFILERIKDFEEAVCEVDRFLPYVDNWATCDLMSPKVFSKHLPELLEKIREWVSSEKTYTVRFGVEMLMSHYLDSKFSVEYPEMVCAIISDEYYVNMMRAWYFATALAKQYDNVISYIENRRLDIWTHNKTIQKATESYRITDEQKQYLRTLKIR